MQPKLNGIRALYQAGCFQSRDEHPFPVGLLEHLAAPLRQIFDESVILDGELYKHGWSLQRINGAVTPVRKEEKEDTKLVEYHVFDVVDFTKSWQERFSMNLLAPLDVSEPARPAILVPTMVAENEVDANRWYATWVAQGYEGMMYRLGDCPYTTPKQIYHNSGWNKTIYASRTKFLSDQDNRCWHLLKRKSWQDAEFEVVGVVEGEGKYEGMLGSITCSIDEQSRAILFGEKITGRTFTVGSGISDLDRLKYWDHPELIIGKLAKVKYLCLSKEGKPLNPTLLAIL